MTDKAKDIEENISESDETIRLDSAIKAKKDGKTTADNIKDIAKNTAKKAAAAPVVMVMQTVKNGVKSTISKANPFDKQISKDDVMDSGVESIRLAYTSAKKAKNSVKTVKSSIKTTRRTIKTTGKAAKEAVRIAYKTPIFIAKTAIRAARITGTIAVNVIAFAMNPIVSVIAVLLLFLIINAGAVVLILGGGASATSSNAKAQGNAAGLVDVPNQYQNAVNFLDTAVQSRKDDFYTMIEELYYSYDDLTHSDLVYMEKTDASGGKTIYETGFAVDERKSILQSAWDFSADDVRSIIAVAYVYLEKQENIVHGTHDGIYEVTYTQEVFDIIAEKCVNFNDSVYSGQSCGTGCTRHVEVHRNPEHDRAVEETEHFWNAYDEWLVIAEFIAYHDTIRNGAAQAAYWDNNIQWRINNWKLVYFDSCYYSNGGQDYADDLYSWYSNSYDYMVTVPEEIEEVTYICENQHELHSIGLWYYNKESIMDALEFTSSEKEWVSLTEIGFENNPDIP